MKKSQDQVVEVLRRLDEHGDQVDWVGPDPYEGLNATRVPRALTNKPLGKRLLIQAVKRSPLDLRRPLGISPTPNATTNAWVLSGYCTAPFLRAAEQRDRTERAVERLLGLRSPRFRTNAWGYLFPTQSRVFFYDRGWPATVTTVWAGHALLDAAQRLERPALVDEAVSAADFLMTEVPQTNDPPGAFIGYLAGDRSPIHNSNLLGCALLARVSMVTGDTRYREAARQGIEWSLARQRPDGSWPYGEAAGLGWVDGFHTGYVIDALDICERAGVDVEIEPARERALAYYRKHLFLGDGTPKYFGDRTYPVDASCVAQAIQTFAIAAERDVVHLDHAWRVFEWALQNMRRSDGLFLFQRHRYWVNPVPHMRWAQATMFLALSHLLRRVQSLPIEGSAQ